MDTTRLDRLKERFLLAAAKGGRLEELISLLELGADSENCLFGDGEQGGQDEEGIEEEGNDTPLIAAARAGHAEIVSVLLANGRIQMLSLSGATATPSTQPRSRAMWKYIVCL